MDFTDLTEKTECPYNPQHIFDKSKLIYHLGRCKDKEKVKHLFTSCQYNKIHIFKKEDIETHELICPDKDEVRNLTQQLRTTLSSLEYERERSREKLKKEQSIKEERQKPVKGQHYSVDTPSIEQCPLCQKIIGNLGQMKKEIDKKEVLQKIAKVEKYLKLADQLEKMKVKFES